MQKAHFTVMRKNFPWFVQSGLAGADGSHDGELLRRDRSRGDAFRIVSFCSLQWRRVRRLLGHHAGHGV